MNGDPPFERLSDAEYAKQSYETVCNLVILLSLDEQSLRALDSPPYFDVGLEAWSDSHEVVGLLARSDTLLERIDADLARAIATHLQSMLELPTEIWTIEGFANDPAWVDSRRSMREFVDQLGLTGVPYSK